MSSSSVGVYLPLLAVMLAAVPTSAPDPLRTELPRNCPFVTEPSERPFRGK